MKQVFSNSKYSYMKQIILAMLAMLMVGHTSAIGLQQALKERKIKITASSSGGLHLHLNVQNITAMPVDIELEPALIFKPTDTGYQDMVLMGGEHLALGAHGQDSLEIKSYCGKSYAH